MSRPKEPVRGKHDKRRRRVCTTLSALASLAVFAACNAADAPLQVKTTGGWVRGRLERGVISFKGIPYAAPPVGRLRWAPPQPAPSWRGVRAARTYGHDCMQLPMPHRTAWLRTIPSEDCLYVNVWRPEHSSAHRLPVMVWVYGGGFVNGGTSPAEYDGRQFARDGVMLVSFNYRLGDFGFFAFPALRRGGGNFALMDQVAALRWVHRNIARFGGDPNNVTVFGESAGGMSVLAMLEDPLTNGLFQKAIIESGAGRNDIPMLPARPLLGGPASAEAMGVRLARHFGIRGEGRHSLGELRALSPSTVLDGLNMASLAQDQAFAGAPIIDGRLYFGTPVRVFADGRGVRVPVMIGANSADLGFMPEKSLKALFSSFGPDAEAARTLYDPSGRSTLRQVSAEVGGDRWMIEPARAIARVLSNRGQPVYEYRFSYVASSMRGLWRGAPHATEIPFVFDTLKSRYGKHTSVADETMARIVHAYWVAFAKTSRPDPTGEPRWPRYRARADMLMNFTERGPVFERDPLCARLNLEGRVAERRAKVR